MCAKYINILILNNCLHKMHKLSLDDIMTISRTCLSIFSNNDLDFTQKHQLQYQASFPNKLP